MQAFERGSRQVSSATWAREPRAIGLIMAILTASLTFRVACRFPLLSWLTGPVLVAFSFFESAEGCSEFVFYFVERFCVRVRQFVKVLGTCFVEQEVAARPSRYLIATHCLVFSSLSFCACCCLNFHVIKIGLELTIMKAETKACDENSLSSGVWLIKVDLQNEKSWAMHIVRDGFFASLSHA